MLVRRKDICRDTQGPGALINRLRIRLGTDQSQHRGESKPMLAGWAMAMALVIDVIDIRLDTLYDSNTECYVQG
jgi:hypothetical protein